MKRSSLILLILCGFLLFGCSSSDNKQSDNFQITEKIEKQKESIQSVKVYSNCYKNNDVNDCLKGTFESHDFAEAYLYPEPDETYFNYKLKELYQAGRGCQLNNPELCYMTFSVIYFPRYKLFDSNNKYTSLIDYLLDGHSVEERQDLAFYSLKKSCDLNLAKGCDMLAHIKMYEKDLKGKEYISSKIAYDDRIKFSEKACSLDAKYCDRLALFLKKRGKEGDFEKAVDYSKKACKADSEHCIDIYKAYTGYF